MEFVKLRDSEFKASCIGLGTWAIGGWMWGGSDERESIRTIHAALDKGINLIDTAPVYGFGRSEEIVGKAVAGYGNRDKIIIATKVGLEWRDDEIVRNSTKKRIRKEIDDSLKRLGTDYIDIYQVHWPDSRVPVAETAESLLELQQAGKIRSIGVSNYSPEQMDRFREAAPLHTTQPPYNLFEREIERDVLPYCRDRNITTLTYGVLCRGLLSGKMQSDTKFTGDDLRKVDPKFQPPRYAQYLQAVDQLDRFAREHYDKRVIHLAVRWVLDQPGASIALWGARRPQQLDAMDSVLGWSLDKEAKEEIDQIVRTSIKEPVGPEFMAPPT
ncbi:aldo/keto reductase [candidate division KSB1 bacterium]|nr:aldo/keto reductase [candidate division KSB1 bacterium]NIR69206.1 aldo/keto reductase [candidate division KSB1 bacterium]NIS27383.1 aldo/keto reductase [candidate division KSB1 bacterium]NIT74208.1 aldo/keto reductase [candidate division KSB1 bacterium]NIU28100.1 aldo/keto reductase [candidate division KSB1 bacterium]